MITQSDAIKAARKIVGSIHYTGGSHTFNVLDAGANAWREGRHYRTAARAQAYRNRALAARALVALGANLIQAHCLVINETGSAAEIVARLADQIAADA